MSWPIDPDPTHRPFPLPAGPWVMVQSWRELLFAHWPVPLEELRALVPAPLHLDQFEGDAWVGLTPFRLTGLRPRFLPPVPFLSEFPEMNLRTYVTAGGVPGIFFFSLDAASTLAVIGARLGYRLPYFRARMSVEERNGWIEYRSRRAGSVEAEFSGRYRSVGPVFHAAPGTVEYFLTERYALFAVLSNGRVLRADIHHPPWPLQRATAEIERNTVGTAHGIESIGGVASLLHFSARQDTLIWPPVIHRVGARGDS